MKVIVVLPAFACEAIKRHILTEFSEADQETFRSKIILSNPDDGMKHATEDQEPVLVFLSEQFDHKPHYSMWIGLRFAGKLAPKNPNAIVVLLSDEIPMPATGVYAIMSGGLGKLAVVLKIHFERLTDRKQVLGALRAHVTEVR